LPVIITLASYPAFMSNSGPVQIAAETNRTRTAAKSGPEMAERSLR